MKNPRSLSFIRRAAAALALALLLPSVGQAATYQWTGASGGNWATAGNWTPTRTTPASGDILHFDTGGNLTVLFNAAASQTIGQLIISNNCTLFLTNANTTARTLVVGFGNPTGTDFDLQTGSQLRFMGNGPGNDDFTLVVSNATASIAGALTLNTRGLLDVTVGTTSTTSVSGSVTNANAANDPAVTGTTTELTFASGGTYTHNIDAGTIPTATWSSGSTCLVTGVTGTAPGGLGQNFHHFTWNCTGQTVANENINALDGTTIGGNFTIASTGSGSVRFSNNGTTALNVTGDFVLSGGTFNGSTGNGVFTLTITGNYSQSAGTFNLGTGAAGTIINLTGNFSQSGGTLTETGTGTAGTELAFNFAGTSTARTFSSAGTIANTIPFTVNSGATVVLNSNIPANTGTTLTVNGTLNCGTFAVTGGGAFTLASGGTLMMASLSGITTTASTGNIQVTGTRTYSTAANYTYAGAAAQVTGNQLPANVNNFTNNNASGVTLTSSVTVSNTLALTSGVLASGANFVGSGLAGTITGAGSSAYVNGTLRKFFPTGALPGTFSFPIGNASVYAPLTSPASAPRRRRAAIWRRRRPGPSIPRSPAPALTPPRARTATGPSPRAA